MLSLPGPARLVLSPTPPRQPGLHARTWGSVGNGGGKRALKARGKDQWAGLGQSLTAPFPPGVRAASEDSFPDPSRNLPTPGVRLVSTWCSRGKTKIKFLLRRRGSNSQHSSTLTCLLAAPAEPANPLSNPRAP